METERIWTSWPPPEIKQSIFSLHTAVLNGIVVFFYSTQNRLTPLSPPFYIILSTKSVSVKKQIYLSDYDKKNAFSIERFLSARLKLKQGEQFEAFDIELPDGNAAPA